MTDAMAALSERFGSDIWKKLEGRRVPDFGCGYGADAVACCRDGIDAVGVERRQFLVESAQQKATELGMGSRFYNVNDCACLAGTFDCILSVNSFEHYVDPAGVLQSMSQFLKPNGGLVLVYFSPPWLDPHGAHCREMTAFPWLQFFFPERAVMRLQV